MTLREETRTEMVPRVVKYSAYRCDVCRAETGMSKDHPNGWGILFLDTRLGSARSMDNYLDVCPKCAVGVGEMMAKKSAASAGAAGGGPVSGGSRG